MSRLPSYTRPSALKVAQEIVDSEFVLGVFAACEWDELHDDGKLWVSAIVEEARRRFAEPAAPSFQFSNVRPAPFALTPPVVGSLLNGTTAASSLVAVPIHSVKLVDQARGSIEPRAATGTGWRAGGRAVDRPRGPVASSPAEVPDNHPVPPTIVKDGGEEPERVAPPVANLSAPVESLPPAPAGAESFATNDTPEPVAPAINAPPSSVQPNRERLRTIRAAARALEKKKTAQREVRPALGQRNARQVRALPELPTEARLRRLNGAIAYLKRLGILVSVCDRDALVRQYRVTGKRERHLADDVVAYAIHRGFEPDHG